MELTIGQVRDANPDLICRKSIGGRYTAVLEYDPMGPVVAYGEDPQDLHDEITRWRSVRDMSAEGSASGY